MHPASEPFRILMVLDHPFPPDIRVENEARTLVDAGFEVGLLSIGPDARRERETWNGIRIFRCRIPKEVRNKLRGLAGTFPFLTWFIDREVHRIHGECAFDALHMHDLYTFGGGLRAGRRLRVPVVGDLHENYVDALKHYRWSSSFPGKFFVSIDRWRRLEKRWVGGVDRLIVVVDEAAQRNVALGVQARRVAVVPNTIRFEDFDEMPRDEALITSMRSDLTVVYTGGIDVHRGLASVILAMQIVLGKLPGARLVVVGDGRIRPDLEELAVRSGLASRIRFEGWQPQPRVKSYILGSDVCLVPHLKTEHTDASMPHKLFHYMYLKRPVVVTDCRPIRKVVEDADCGTVCPDGDPAAMAEALLTLAADGDMRQRMAESGHAAVLDRYNWNATAKPLVRMYRELAAEKRNQAIGETAR